MSLSPMYFFADGSSHTLTIDRTTSSSNQMYIAVDEEDLVTGLYWKKNVFLVGKGIEKEFDWHGHRISVICDGIDVQIIAVDGITQDGRDYSAVCSGLLKAREKNRKTGIWILLILWSILMVLGILRQRLPEYYIGISIVFAFELALEIIWLKKVRAKAEEIRARKTE